MNTELTVSARSLASALLKAFAVILFFHLVVVFSHLGMHWRMSAFTVLFDMDLEANLPVFFNCALFFVLAATCWLAGRTEKDLRKGWFLLVLVFTFLGIDEGSQIHERFMLWTQRLMNPGDPGTDMGFLHYAWVIPYLAGGLIVLLALLRFLLKLPAGTRNGLVVSGVVYVTGAAVMEMVSGKIARPLEGEPTAEALAFLPCSAYSVGECNLYLDVGYVLAYTIEESLEMLGLIACAYVVMRHLQRGGRSLMLRIPELG